METVAVKSEYELERGKPMPSKNHSIIQSNIHFHLRLNYGKQYKILPELNVEVSEKRKVPDIAIYDDLKFTPNKDEIEVEKTPLGAIEILSPTQSLEELIAKSKKYFDKGVKSYWLVLPALEAIYVFYEFGSRSHFHEGEILEDLELGIQLDLSKIFDKS